MSEAPANDRVSARDRVTRTMAVVALGLSGVAVALGAYSVKLSQDYLDELREIAKTLSGSMQAEVDSLPMRPPPLELDPDPE